MRNLIAIGILVFVVLYVSTLSYADAVGSQKDVTVHMQVDSQFGLQIRDNEFDQQLPNLVPGGGATGDVHIYATSNHSIPWTINAGCGGLVRKTKASPDTLPVKISTYDGGTGLTGTIVTDLELTGTAQPIYTAGAGEYQCAGLQVNAIFSVTSQTDTRQGIYNGILTLTMTE